MRPFLLRLLLLLLGSCPLWCPVYAQSADNRPSILYINSYYPGYPWSDSVYAGIRSTLQHIPDLDLYVEYLDSRRFTDKQSQEDFAEHLANKYPEHNFDLILLSDDAALEFWQIHRDDLAPEVPVVFCGINNFTSLGKKGMAGATGVSENIDPSLSLVDALNLFPATTDLVFILSDDDPSSRANSQIAQSIIPGYSRTYKTHVLQNATLPEIRRRLAKLPPSTLVFLFGQQRETGPHPIFDAQESSRRISAASPFPVFGFWEFQIGTGILGGRVLRGSDQGSLAARIALRILSGTPADSIPVQEAGSGALIFDGKALQRFHISSDQLSPDAHIVNQQDGLWQNHGGKIIGIALAMLLESSLILWLFITVRRRRHTEHLLQRERSRLARTVDLRTRELQEKTEALENSLLERETLLDNALVTILHMYNRRIQWVSGHAQEMFGYDPSFLKGLSAEILYNNYDDFVAIGETVYRTIQYKKSFAGEVEMRRADGSAFWANLFGKAISTTHPELGFLFVLVDIDKQKKLEQKLRDANRHLQSTQDMLDRFVPIAEFDLQGKVAHVNEAFCLLSGYTPGEMIGRSYTEFHHPDMPPETIEAVLAAVRSGSGWSGEIQSRHKNGNFFWAHTHLVPIEEPEGTIIGFRSIRRDITDRKRVEELSVTDHLTGIFNRAYLDQSMQAQFDQAQRYDSHFSFIIIDIDKFKNVNDTYGHQVGDQVLCGTAGIMKRQLRRTDILGRYGGEEFLVIAPQTPLDNACNLAEKLRTALENHVHDTVGVRTASFGVSTYRAGDTLESMLRRADEALYAAKHNGRNRVESEPPTPTSENP